MFVELVLRALHFVFSTTGNFACCKTLCITSNGIIFPQPERKKSFLLLHCGSLAAMKGRNQVVTCKKKRENKFDSIALLNQNCETFPSKLLLKFPYKESLNRTNGLGTNLLVSITLVTCDVTSCSHRDDFIFRW